MRPIKFRGIAKESDSRIDLDEGSWVHGWLLTDEVGWPSIRVCFEIQPSFREPPEHMFSDVDIDPKTIGQYTGLKDRGGVEIYEGDLIKWGMRLFAIQWNEVNASWTAPMIAWADETEMEKGDFKSCPLRNYNPSYAVVGNIHQNPELLKN